MFRATCLAMALLVAKQVAGNTFHSVIHLATAKIVARQVARTVAESIYFPFAFETFYWANGGKLRDKNVNSNNLGWFANS